MAAASNSTEVPVEVLRSLELEINKMAINFASIRDAVNHLVQSVEPQDAWLCTAIESMSTDGRRVAEDCLNKTLKELHRVEKAREGATTLDVAARTGSGG